MKPSVNDRYSIEELQEHYGLSLPQAVAIFDKFSGDKVETDKMMKRFPSAFDKKEIR